MYFDDCLILAGGSGTRLWPTSTSLLPKQFMPASSNRDSSEKSCFFSMAIERALSCISNDGKVIIITGKSYIPHIISASSKLSVKEKKHLLVIGETEAKNTAPAIACAVKYSLLNGNNRNMLVLTSDHIIKPLESFISDASIASTAANERQLVLFGIPPSSPQTGYGYIETTRFSLKVNKPDLYIVQCFHEKPDEKKAKKYAASRHFFWNSGMFAFRNDFIEEQFLLHAPDVFCPFEKLKNPKQTDYISLKGIKVLETWKGLAASYNKTKSISFDYAIAEKCRKTVMVRAGFDWIDIGNWDEYVKLLGKGISQVYTDSEINSCFVDSDIPVALAGVDDLIIVIRSGKKGETASALITKKGQTEKVKNVVEKIKKAQSITFANKK